jgi:hypothetical protein
MHHRREDRRLSYLDGLFSRCKVILCLVHEVFDIDFHFVVTLGANDWLSELWRPVLANGACVGVLRSDYWNLVDGVVQ